MDIQAAFTYFQAHGKDQLIGAVAVFGLTNIPWLVKTTFHVLWAYCPPFKAAVLSNPGKVKAIAQEIVDEFKSDIDASVAGSNNVPTVTNANPVIIAPQGGILK